MSGRHCPYCGQPIKVERRAAASDQALLEALKHPSTKTYGRGGLPSKPWLYAAADQYDSRKADLNRWYVTGPDDRKGYIKGPFAHEQVERVASTGRLRRVCSDDEGRAIAYELAK